MISLSNAANRRFRRTFREMRVILRIDDPLQEPLEPLYVPTNSNYSLQVGPCFFFVRSCVRSFLFKDGGMRLVCLLRILTKSLPLQGFVSFAQQGCLSYALHTFPKSHAAFRAQPPTLSRRNKRPDSDDVINDSCIIVATIILVEFFLLREKNTFAAHDHWRIYRVQ